MILDKTRSLNDQTDKIRKKIVKALADFNMLQDQDKVMVAVSGGKDSSVILYLLNEIQKRAPYNFSIEAVMLDQKHPGFSTATFKSWVETLGIKLTIIERDTYSIVKEKVQGRIYCSLCSKLRRAILYDHAAANGFTKIVLGHHRDDIIETLLLNIFYTGKMATMPAKLLSDDKRNIIIRPLVYVSEKEIIELAQLLAFPILPCNLCGSQEGMKRQRIKKLISSLETEIPELGSSVLGAMGNVHPSHLIDHQLWNFKEITDN